MLFDFFTQLSRNKKKILKKRKKKPTSDTDNRVEGDKGIDQKTQSQLGRKDFTKKLSKTERRLDTFCDLIGAHSQCISASVVERELKISSNDFFRGTQKPEANQQLRSIEKITKYFSRISKKETLRSNERKEIFLEICSVNRFNIKFKTSFSKKLGAKIANKVLIETLQK